MSILMLTFDFDEIENVNMDANNFLLSVISYFKLRSAFVVFPWI